MWQIALAARASKYGISLYDALWTLPFAFLNQLMVWDELCNGRQPRWTTDQDQTEKELDELLADALTVGL